jgi:HK97 family phage major capsid protein
MKTLQELMALKNSRAERIKALIAITDRALTDAENAEITQIREDADNLETQIRNAQFLADQKAAAAAKEFEGRAPLGLDPGTGAAKSPEDKVMDQFSLARAVQQLNNDKKLSGAEAEANAIGRAEALQCGVTPGSGLYIRSVNNPIESRANAATPLAASNLIATGTNATQIGYRAHLPIEALGATVIRNLEGIQNYPIADLLATAGYVGENAAVPAIDVNVRQAVLNAKQVCAKLPITMLLQAKAGSEAERIALMTLEQAEGEAVTRGIISGVGSSTVPQGILGNTDVPNLDLAASGAMTFLQLLKMKNSPGKNNARFIQGKPGWLTNDNVREQLENMANPTTDKPVWDYERPDMLMGRMADTTTLVPNNAGVGTNESAIIYGIWANLAVANWSFKRLVIDETTVPGSTVLNWYSFWDHVIMSPKAFAKCRNIIAA